MILQVEIRDLRRMLKEKCEEIISDEKVADAFYCRMCEVEDDDRFTVADEAHELTKSEWEHWKKDKNREPICMVWYRDTTPIWVLEPEKVNEYLYLTEKIKLFNKKPRKEQVIWK